MASGACGRGVLGGLPSSWPPARVVGGSRAAIDDTGSGGSEQIRVDPSRSGACPKPLVLLSKTLTFRRKYLFYLIKLMFFKENRCFAQ